MKVVNYLILFVACCILLGMLSIFGLYKYIEPDLPDVATLKDVRMQLPMQVYSADGKLIAQFGEKRRIPVTISQLPPQLIHAFIATEDSRFYDHHGVDPVGIARAFLVAASSGHATQGASTITQQLARNFFLSPERTLTRKIKEVFLAVRIEKTLTKDEILELYINKIYLGYRAYGVGAAAHVYFGKEVNQLTLSEMAMIAGLPKAPSTFNPIYSHDRAITRRNVVLSRMLQEEYITEQQYQQAIAEPLVASYHIPEIDFPAPYLAEMVRQEMFKRYGENAYTEGYKVYTTVTKSLQLAAEKAVRDNVIDYDMRHGYRGPAAILWKTSEAAWNPQKIAEHLKTVAEYGPLLPAVAIKINESVHAVLANGQRIEIPFAGIRWARPFRTDSSQGSTPKRASDVVQIGQQIWVRRVGEQWWLAQAPDVNSALVSIDAQNGALQAIVGGFDFEQSKFNRATQALRQVGSNIKPLIYAAALDKGLTLGSVINDLPITQWDVAGGSDWRPKNSPDTYDGPMRIRQALGLSKNVVMVRTMRAIGVDYAADYLMRFGLPAANITRTESLALGSAAFTPYDLVRAYAVFTNGGFLVDPYFISRIENDESHVIEEAKPHFACATCNIPVIYAEPQKALANVGQMNLDDSPDSLANTKTPVQTAAVIPNMQVNNAEIRTYAPHVISTPIAFLMSDALNSNVFGEPGGGWTGTGWRAGKELKRRDIGGKTGTTNSSKDAWFSGYGANIATTVWIGFDDHRRTLGQTFASGAIKDQISGMEAGAKSAQPAWNAYMKVALQNIPEQPKTVPEGIISVSIDRYSGGLSQEGGNSKMEYFLKGTEPTSQISQGVGPTFSEGGEEQELF